VAKLTAWQRLAVLEHQIAQLKAEETELIAQLETDPDPAKLFGERYVAIRRVDPKTGAATYDIKPIHRA